MKNEVNNVEIVEVKTKKQIKDFINYPLKLYKGNEFFVPLIYSDEKVIFSKKLIHRKTCDQIFFLAYRNNHVVGRIQGIIQKQYNEINGTKKARFTRFDCEDNVETAGLLLKAVENWAKGYGLEEVIGPMGYNDLEREGLLIEGFDYLSTYEEQYNYPYYQNLIESNGYEKDVDWLEYRMYPEFYEREKLRKFAARAERKLNLHVVGEKMGKSKYIDTYGPGIFECLDECYKELYGTVPFSSETRESMISQFKLVLNMKYIITICDEEEKVVAFGILIPGIGKALQKSGGRLTIPAIFRLLKAINHPESLDFALIGILPKYRGAGLNAYIICKLQDILEDSKVKYLESNLNLETNINVQGQWKYFKNIQHKRRRAFIKKI